MERVVGRRNGSSEFDLDSGWTLTFHRVLYVPPIRVNVLLVSVLKDQGYTI